MTAAVFEALGDPTRRQIMEALALREQAVSAVVEALRAQSPISQPAVSQHLKVLREAGLVTVRPDGTRRLYAVDRAGIEAARRWIDGLDGPAGRLDQPLDALATEVERGKRQRRAQAAPATRRRRPA